MATINNFNKIHDTKIKIDNVECRIEVERWYNNVWIYEDDNSTVNIFNGHALWFEFNWKVNSFNVKKCETGHGNVGTYVVQDASIDLDSIKTSDAFIKFVKFIAARLVWNKLL
jgi:hypothetical protein